MPDVILVDEHDRQIGVSEKYDAHVAGLLHRAVSVFILDPSGEKMLLQQRAAGKYHSPGLWSNACCTHPEPGETPMAAAHRRLGEELGFDCELAFAFSFTYRADVGQSLIEHEFDHVFIGRCVPKPAPNPAEVAAVEWVDVQTVLRDVEARPDRYTPWLRIALSELQGRALL